MNIHNLFLGTDLTVSSKYTEWTRDGESRLVSAPILTEHVLDLYMNEILTMKLVCMPEYLPELAVGRLLSEGMIRDAEDIISLSVCQYGKKIKVFLQKTEEHDINGQDSMDAGANAESDTDYVETTQTCCTANHLFHEYFVQFKEPDPVIPIPWETEEIFALADRFAEGTSVHKKTWSTHSCMLARGSKVLFSCEDIGRHNALDKALGYALIQGIDLKECTLFSSGRIPVDMVIKAIRAGVPILVSKAQATEQAVQMATEYGLTLITGARPDRMRLMAGSCWPSV